MHEDFYRGVMSALAVVYQQDDEVLAEEIVRSVGSESLLRVAKAEDDVWLSALRRTIKEVRRRKRIGA